MPTENYHITQKDFHQLWRNLKTSAAKRGIEFSLSLSDMDVIGIPLTCPVLGIPIYFHHNKVMDDSISFDRIDSNKGYTVDNIIVVSYRVNKLKSNATLDEMKLITSFYEHLNDV